MSFGYKPVTQDDLTLYNKVTKKSFLFLCFLFLNDLI